MRNNVHVLYPWTTEEKLERNCTMRGYEQTIRPNTSDVMVLINCFIRILI
jgi:hypothetical protein